MSALTTPAVLPQADLDFLNEKGWQYDIALHPGEMRIYIRNFLLPKAYSPRATDLLIRLPFGYRSLLRMRAGRSRLAEINADHYVSKK
jgi:E2/UBC family protein E